MNSRTLRLRQETLAHLTTDELGAVDGAANTTPYIQSFGCPTTSTLLPTCDCTGLYPSLNAPCSLAC